MDILLSDSTVIRYYLQDISKQYGDVIGFSAYGTPDSEVRQFATMPFCATKTRDTILFERQVVFLEKQPRHERFSPYYACFPTSQPKRKWKEWPDSMLSAMPADSAFDDTSWAMFIIDLRDLGTGKVLERIDTLVCWKQPSNGYLAYATASNRPIYARTHLRYFDSVYLDVEERISIPGNCIQLTGRAWTEIPSGVEGPEYSQLQRDWSAYHTATRAITLSADTLAQNVFELRPRWVDQVKANDEKGTLRKTRTLNLVVRSSIELKGVIALLDLKGRLLHSTPLRIERGKHTIAIDCSALRSTPAIVRVTTNDIGRDFALTVTP